MTDTEKPTYDELAAAVLAWDTLNPTMNAHLTAWHDGSDAWHDGSDAWHDGSDAWHDGSDMAETKRVAGLLYDLAERLRMIGADE